MHKTLLIDIDGVACAHARSVCMAVNRDYGISSKEEDVILYDYNFGPITFIEAVEKYYPQSEFILNMKVTEGFQEFLCSITKIMMVKFATARKYSHDATRLWIMKNFGDNFEIIFAANKIDTEFDYLIDDYPLEVEKASIKGKKGFLISRPWNNNTKIKEKFKGLPNALFVENFSEIKDYLLNNL